MKSHDGAQENAPQYKPESAYGEQREPEYSPWHKMVLREPDTWQLDVKAHFANYEYWSELYCDRAFSEKKAIATDQY
jgi:hypothetical protein